MTDETLLIRRILDGHPDDYRQLMLRYGDMIMDFIGSIVGSREDAEELTQNTFVNAYRSLSTYDRRKASLATWLCRIAYHETVRHVKRKRPPVISLDDDSQLVDEAVDREAEEWLTHVTEQRIQLLEEAIGQLSDYDQTLLRLYYKEDLPLKEIAFILDSEAARLANRLQRIRNRLYRMIKNKTTI